MGTLRFRNPANDYVEEMGGVPFWAAVFGWCYFAYCRAWAAAAIWFVVLSLYSALAFAAPMWVHLLAALAVAVIQGSHAQETVTNAYLRRGWKHLEAKADVWAPAGDHPGGLDSWQKARDEQIRMANEASNGETGRSPV